MLAPAGSAAGLLPSLLPCFYSLEETPELAAPSAAQGCMPSPHAGRRDSRSGHPPPPPWAAALWRAANASFPLVAETCRIVFKPASVEQCEWLSSSSIELNCTFDDTESASSSLNGILAEYADVQECNRIQKTCHKTVSNFAVMMRMYCLSKMTAYVALHARPVFTKKKRIIASKNRKVRSLTS